MHNIQLSLNIMQSLSLFCQIATPEGTHSVKIYFWRIEGPYMLDFYMAQMTIGRGTDKFSQLPVCIGTFGSKQSMKSGTEI